MNKIVLTLSLLLAPSLLAVGEDLNPSTQALPQKEVPVTVESMSADVQDHTTAITITLNKKPINETPVLEDHGTFMQIVLTGTMIAKPGEFVDVRTPYVSKLVGFQTHPETTSLRLFVTQEANYIKQASVVGLQDNKIIISIDHKKVEELLKVDPSLTAKTSSTPSAEDIIAKTEIDTAIVEPAKILKNDEDKLNHAEATTAPTAMVFKDGGSLNKRLISASIFCAIMLLGLLAVYVFKPRLKRFRQVPDDYAAIVMKTLSTHKVSPKQRLELIDVGGEKILIAISPDQVSFLTTVGASQQKMIGESQMTMQAMRPKALAAGHTEKVNPLAQNKTITTAAQPTRRIVTTQRAGRQEAIVETPNSRRIETKVGGDIKMDYRRETSPKSSANNQTISDVTRLIREKLKNLPSI